MLTHWQQRSINGYSDNRETVKLPLPPTVLKYLRAKPDSRNPYHRLQAMRHPHPARARGVGSAPSAVAPAHRAGEGRHRLALYQVRQAPVGADAVRNRGTGIVATETQ
jgi:hypothetical protein